MMKDTYAIYAVKIILKNILKKKKRKFSKREGVLVLNLTLGKDPFLDHFLVAMTDRLCLLIHASYQNM